MKAQDSPFTKFINGTKQFLIPVFQRDYSWSEEECLELWSDVVRMGRESKAGYHFIGSLVYAPAHDMNAGFTKWLLIDGQQRLTTLTLLVAALRRRILDSGWVSKAPDSVLTAKKLQADFLKNVAEDGDREAKLVLRRVDRAALESILADESTKEHEGSRIVENFEMFRELVAEEDPEVVFRGICKLQIVDVTLDRTHDDPQVVFESLNSTGRELSQSDQIRNFVLMRLEEREQTRLYEKYWSKIEMLYEGAPRQFDSFARDYLALGTRATRQPRSDDVYREFSRFFRERVETLGLDAILAEMLRFAGYHAAFALGASPSKMLRPALGRVNRLAEVAAILVMRLFDCHDRLGTLSESQLVGCLDMIESYVFRRNVCGMQSRGYWAVFALLADRLNETNPASSLASLLYRLTGNYKFPSDEEFVEELTRRDVYHMRTAHYLLDRLENHGSKEPSDTSSLSIEHVMPQNPKISKAWREMLGDDAKRVHQTWLHRLGNLTLTGYNSTYSDRPFEEKKLIADGFSVSAVRLNRFVREQSAWNEDTMIARSLELASRAKEAWPALVVEDAALKDASQNELKRQAAKQKIEDVEMTADARSLFERLRGEIISLDPGVIEVPRRRSISYHSPDGDFFVEVLPRKSRLLLLIDLELSECEYLDARLRDTSDNKFLTHATQWGGVVYNLNDEAWVVSAMKVVKQALAIAAQ